ncbi:cell division protein FtsL, partial [Klebsiella pneumoniae]
RLLNLLAVLGLIGSAGYAYSIKYDTLYQAGQVSKLKGQLHKERQSIAVLRAEWQLLTRPDRLQAAVE